MTHSLANIEHHHFKYAGFRRPGDVHCHYFGTATLSFAAGVTVQPGDVFEVDCRAVWPPAAQPRTARPPTGCTDTPGRRLIHLQSPTMEH